MENNRRYCKKCVLYLGFPGVVIDEKTGLCNHCIEFQKKDKRSENLKFKQEIRCFFDGLKGTDRYDLIVALSGGKDSSYTMYQIHELYPKLRIMGVMVDNGFISDNAKENAVKICKYTSADFKIINIGGKDLNSLFSKAIKRKGFSDISAQRASSMCLVCSGIFKQLIIAEAIRNNVPAIAFGWTHGQSKKPIISLNADILLWNRNDFQNYLTKISRNKNEDLSRFIPDSKLFRIENSIKMLHPLVVWGYNEEKIIEKLSKEVNWLHPRTNDANSSNCILNSLATKMHLKQYGIHPYAMEIAGLVRSGRMTRKQGMKKLEMGSLTNKNQINNEEELLLINKK